MSLYSISADVQALMDSLEDYTDENGEINPRWFEMIEETENKLTEKADNIIKFVRNLESDNLAIANEIERLREVAKRNDKKADGLKAYVLNVMERFGKDTLDGTIGQLKITKSTATIIEDETKLPDKFRKTEIIPASERITYPKADIKKAIEAGEEVPGAHLEFRKDVKIK